MRAVPTRTNIAIDTGSGGTLYPNWDRTASSGSSKRQFYQGSNHSAISSAIVGFSAEL